jgi:hypothetical protein
MTWIVTQSSTTLGTLPADRLDSHFRVLQRDAGVLIVAANASTGPFESYESATARRILDVCEQTLDAREHDEDLLEAIAVRLRMLMTPLGYDATCWLTAIWLAGDRLELWSNGRDDLVVFAEGRAIVQHCTPRLRIGPGAATMVGTGSAMSEEPIQQRYVDAERLRVVLLHRMASEMSFLPAVMGWQRARPDTSTQELAERTHGWVFDRGQQLALVAVVDSILA